jgi:hypothetical protein
MYGIDGGLYPGKWAWSILDDGRLKLASADGSYPGYILYLKVYKA